MLWLAGILALMLLGAFWPTDRRRCCTHLNQAHQAFKQRNWPALQRALELLREPAGRLSGPLRSHFLGHAALLEAHADYLHNRLDDCRTHLDEAVCHIVNAQAPDEHLRMAEVHRLRGDLCFDLGRTDEAADHFRSAVASDQSIGSDGLIIFDLQRLSDVLLSERRFDEAKSYIERAMQLEEKLVRQSMVSQGQDPTAIPTISMSKPDHSLATRDWRTAEALFREKVEHWTRLVTRPDNIDVSRYQFHLATAQQQLGRHEDAIVTLRRACDTVKHDFGADHARMARALEKLADALQQASEEREAADTAKQAMALRARA